MKLSPILLKKWPELLIIKKLKKKKKKVYLLHMIQITLAQSKLILNKFLK